MNKIPSLAILIEVLKDEDHCKGEPKKQGF
jgi:hypothetical protein